MKGGIEFRLKPEIYFNFLGQFDQGTEEGVLEESPYPVGQVLSPNLERLSRFNIMGLINKGSLEISINYNKNEYREESIRSLLYMYQNNLINLIEN